MNTVFTPTACHLCLSLFKKITQNTVLISILSDSDQFVFT